MTDRACITNADFWNNVHRADRPFPCRRRGMHYAACADPDSCWGCVPRSASHGFLCPVCWSKLEDALARVGDLCLHLRSIEKPAQALEERVSTSMERSVLVPDSWQAADGLLEAMGADPFPSTMTIDDAAPYVADVVAEWGEHVDGWVNTVEGAKRAVVLIRRMQTALRRWPDSEAQYRPVPMILCPTCHQRTLWRRAPLEFRDEILIECATPKCDYSRDWFEWQDAYRTVLEAIFREQDRAAGRRPRHVLDHKNPKVSEECRDGDHGACVSLNCQCDCHERTWSLYSVPVPYHTYKHLLEKEAS